MTERGHEGISGTCARAFTFALLMSLSRTAWYPHLQWFQRIAGNCGKVHVRIILGYPIVLYSHVVRRFS